MSSARTHGRVHDRDATRALAVALRPPMGDMPSGAETLAIVEDHLRSGADPDGTGDPREPSPLHQATTRGAAAAVAALLAAGADPDRGIDMRGLPPTAAHPCYIRPPICSIPWRDAPDDGMCILEALVAAGADIHAVDDRGANALRAAAADHAVAAVGRLIGLGCDPGRGPGARCTPLSGAAMGTMTPAQAATMRHLLEAGADLHATSHAGKTPASRLMDGITSHSWNADDQEPPSVETLLMLLHAGDDPMDGWTPGRLKPTHDALLRADPRGRIVAAIAADEPPMVASDDVAWASGIAAAHPTEAWAMGLLAAASASGGGP